MRTLTALTDAEYKYKRFSRFFLIILQNVASLLITKMIVLSVPLAQSPVQDFAFILE